MKTSTEFMLATVALAAGLIAAGCGSHDGKALPTASIAGASDSGGKDLVSSEPKTPADPAHPVVQMHTSLGDITLRLDAKKSPITVGNFLAYVSSGQYDNTLFHQVMSKPAVILGGGYDTFYKERPAEIPIRNEAHNGLKNARGTLAMARAEVIDSSTCQFFINTADNPGLNYRDETPAGYGYCVFGEVIDGMDVVDKIARSTVGSQHGLTDTPIDPVIIRWIHVVR